MMLTDRQLQSLRNLGCEFEEAADEIVALRAKIEALRKDAERYRELAAAAGALIDMDVSWRRGPIVQGAEKRLRAAIDAAMATLPHQAA